MAGKRAGGVKRVALLSAGALVLTGAFVFAVSRDDPSSSNTPMGDRHVSSSECDNADVVSRGRGRRMDQSLSGDVDGDGTEDEIFLAHDDAGGPGCKSFVVVDVAGPEVYTAAVDPSGTPRALPEPRLKTLADIDGEPGLEIVVDVEMGASTQFAAVFVLDDSLERLDVKGRGPGPFAAGLAREDLFPYGGSVGHIEGVDCAEDGHIHLLAAVPAGDEAGTYDVEHRFFLVDGATAVLDSSLSASERLSASEVAELPQLLSSPFGGCD